MELNPNKTPIEVIKVELNPNKTPVDVELNKYKVKTWT